MGALSDIWFAAGLPAIARVTPLTHAARPVRELTLHGWNWNAICSGSG